MEEIELEKAGDMSLFVLAEDYAGYGGYYYAQHGISFLIQVRERPGTSWSMLFDTGTDATPIFHNAEVIGVEIEGIENVLLSHCHYDHTGGLIEILSTIKQDRLPVVAHPQLFRDNFSVDPHLRQAGVRGDIKEKAQEFGAMWTLTKDPVKLARGVVTTGEIPVEERVAYEKSGKSSFYTLSDGQLIEDNMLDDTSLMVNTQKGLVVVTGCSHAGIVSIVKKCKEISGFERVEAVIGGFHLIHADADHISKVANDLKDLNVENVYTGHCTGLQAEAILQEEFGGNFSKLQCGKIFRF